MRSLLTTAAVAAGLTVAQAEVLPRSQARHPIQWREAKETPDLAYQEILGAMPFQPTPAPRVDARRLQARASTDNTCAYVSGNAGKDASRICHGEVDGEEQAVEL